MLVGATYDIRFMNIHQILHTFYQMDGKLKKCVNELDLVFHSFPFSINFNQSNNYE